MVYVGTPPSLNTYGYRDKCRAYVDPSLSVASVAGDREGRGMSYWPGYSDIGPQYRATYLDWLAKGRSDPSYNPGFMFLYFYGLERRFFVDQSTADADDIVREVRRLAALYADNHSVQRYLGEFLDVASVATTDPFAIEPVLDRKVWELPFSLKVALGARIDRGDLLSADWVLSWLICHPEFSLRTPATRCPEEFQALFRMRFAQRYPDGLKVTKPRKTLTAQYRSASSEFNGTLNPTVNGASVSDISGLRKPVEIAQEIAEDATNALDKYSRFIGRNPDRHGSVEAHALLPSELWPLFPSAEIEALRDWASTIAANGGLVSAADVVARLSGGTPEKLGKRELTDVADALARVGFGLAPDPRYALRSPKPDEPVVIFDLGGSVDALENVSGPYRAGLMELALASFVAHADGHIAEAERQALGAHVDAIAGLSDVERRRLRANLDWFLSVPPDLGLLRRRVRDLGHEHHATLRAALVSAALADGIIATEEVAGIEKVYKALGIDPGLAYSDLHAGDLPAMVRAARPTARGEAIPPEQAPTGPLLDAALIAAIRSDTERVSSVLGEIFVDAGEPGDAPVAPGSTVLKGLDDKHAALVRDLVGQGHWTDEDFDRLCADRKLLSAGALEAINEWAYETYDEALLDEYDGYDVAPDIAAALRIEFEKEGQYVQFETP